MKRFLLIIFIFVLSLAGLTETRAISDEQIWLDSILRQEEMEIIHNHHLMNLIDCLEQAGVVIYGSKYCPACSSLVESLGGYQIVDPIYVECADHQETCSAEMQTNYVPEVQIKGDLYQGARSSIAIAEAAGCHDNLKVLTDGLIDLELSVATDKKNYYPDEEIEITIEADGFGALRFNTGCQATYRVSGFDLEDGRYCTMAFTQVGLPNTWSLTHDLKEHPLPIGEHQIIAGLIGYHTEPATINILEESPDEVINQIRNLILKFRARLRYFSFFRIR